MSHRLKRIALVISAGAAFGLLTGIAPANAQVTSCSSKVVDQTSDKVLDIPLVEQSIQNAERFGADIYVRAFDTAPYESLDEYWKQGLRDCSNWSAYNGSEPKPNIVLLSFSLDRKSAVFYGANYGERLRSEIDGIRSSMSPHFRDGDFTAGITTALSGIETSLDPSTSSNSGGSSVSVGTFFKWVGWILLGIVTIIAAILAVILVVRYSQARKDRLREHERAVKAQAEAATLVTNLHERKELEAEFLLAVDSLPESLIQIHKESMRQIQDQIGVYAGKYTELAYDYRTDSSNTKLDRDAYAWQVKEYTAVANNLRKTTDAFKQLIVDIEADEEALTTGDQMRRINAIDQEVSQFSLTLDNYNRLFDTSLQAESITDLQNDLRAVATLSQSEDQSKRLESLHQVEQLEAEFNELRSDFTQLEVSASRLEDPVGRLHHEVDMLRSKLQSLKHADGTSSLTHLAELESEIDDYVTDQFRPSFSVHHQIARLNEFLNRISECGSRALAEEAEEKRKIKAKKDTEEEAARKKRRDEEDERRRRSSSYSSSGAGIVLGYAAGSGFSGGGGYSGGSDAGGSSGSW